MIRTAISSSSTIRMRLRQLMAIEQAVILAGGLGTRMRPMTEQVPKPMLPVNGKPFLEHQMRLLGARGFSRVLLLVGYLGEQIEEYFGSDFRFSDFHSKDAAARGVHIDYAY